MLLLLDFWPLGRLRWPFRNRAALRLVLLMTALCLLNAKRRPSLLVGWFWYIIVLLPVSGVVQMGEMARAERYSYVSLGVARVLIAQQRFAEARGLLDAILRLDAENEEAKALLRTVPSEPAAK